MELPLSGRTAIIMAASDGLGFGTARALARQGARIAICARRKDPLEAAARRLRDETGVDVFASTADVSKDGESARFIDAAVHHFGDGGLDVLVNNSGGPRPGLADTMTDQDWSAAFQLLVLSNVRACRAALPYLRKRGGSIINIVSTSVKQPIENLVLSNSLRAAVIGFAKTLSMEWAPHGIRVNNVCPGSMQTQRIDEVVRSQAQRDGLTFEEARKRREKTAALGRFGTADELGQVIAFLASPAASYVTGQTLSVDGGATRWVHG